MKKKLLYIGNKLSKHGNTATSIETLGSFLEEEGFTMYYASSKKNQFLRMLAMIITTCKLAKKVDYVLIDVYSTKNFWYAFVISQLCRILNLKYITKLHGGNLPNRLKRNPYLSDLIFINAYKITAPSSYLFECFSSRNYNNLLYIPNTINISKYDFTERKVTAPKLLWVRSLARIYNPIMAIKVLNEIKREFPNAELCMVGPDKENIIQECKDFANQLNVSVTFTGKLHKEAWVALSSEYTIFINTSRYDNTPVSIIEAMAIGLPVVSTNVGGIPYLLEDKENALLVNNDDVMGMAKAIQLLINDATLTAMLIKNSRILVETFDWQIVKHQWFDILK
jgi:glycosyltransferase involved in cell wall biosynthesis